MIALQYKIKQMSGWAGGRSKRKRKEERKRKERYRMRLGELAKVLLQSITRKMDRITTSSFLSGQCLYIYGQGPTKEHRDAQKVSASIVLGKREWNGSERERDRKRGEKRASSYSTLSLGIDTSAL